MEMILLDWTRMGKTFCVAGVVPDGSHWRTVRPMPCNLLDTHRSGSPRNVGWFPSKLAQLRRWDTVELIGAKQADVERPHTEDMWVTTMRRTGQTVAPEQRGVILGSTVVQNNKPHFGVPLLHTRTSAYLRPGIGERSLVTVTLPAEELFFEASKRMGTAEVDVRVRLKVPGVGVKQLPVKDHFLLAEAEQSAGAEPVSLAKFLRQAALRMTETVAVRLGLSRGYDVGRGEPRCWLMADGFFPLEEISNVCR